jgi:ubiquinone biosynthesis protein UbiJ
LTEAGPAGGAPGRWLAGLVEAALARYLTLDPLSRERLAALGATVIALELRGLGITLYVLPRGDGLRVSERWSGPVDTTLSGTPWGLLGLITAGDRARVLFEGSVEITGDVELGQRFREVLDAVEFDWEEELSHWVGDIIAHRIGNTVRSASQWGAHASETLRRSLSEYLQEEAEVVPRRYELEVFVDAVDTLRMDADRLEQRVERLRRTLDDAQRPTPKG